MCMRACARTCVCGVVCLGMCVHACAKNPSAILRSCIPLDRFNLSPNVFGDIKHCVRVRFALL